MKIFQSSLLIEIILKLNELDKKLKPNVLITFYGLNRRGHLYTVIYRPFIENIFLDCGAFSLNKKFKGRSLKQESEILFDEYMSYTSLTQYLYDHVASMDDDFSW